MGPPPLPKKARFAKFGKDPTVSTAFLPDRDREREEEDLRNQLRKASDESPPVRPRHLAYLCILLQQAKEGK